MRRRKIAPAIDIARNPVNLHKQALAWQQIVESTQHINPIYFLYLLLSCHSRWSYAWKIKYLNEKKSRAIFALFIVFCGMLMDASSAMRLIGLSALAFGHYWLGITTSSTFLLILLRHSFFHFRKWKKKEENARSHKRRPSQGRGAIAREWCGRDREADWYQFIILGGCSCTDGRRRTIETSHDHCNIIICFARGLFFQTSGIATLQAKHNSYRYSGLCSFHFYFFFIFFIFYIFSHFDYFIPLTGSRRLSFSHCPSLCHSPCQ